MAGAVIAEDLHAPAHSPDRYIGQIQAHTPDEVSDILHRLAGLLDSQSDYPAKQPLALVLHGDEVNAFLRENYAQNRELVDLAARLDAFNAIDIQVCETWMRGAAAQQDDLPAFVDTVPYGPARELELLKEGYEYF